MPSISLNGHTITFKTLIAALTLVVVVAGSIWSVSSAWGQQDQRITTAEGDIADNKAAVQKLTTKVDEIAVEAAKTSTTVQEIKEQLKRDRQNVDTSFQRVLEEIRKQNE